MVAMARAAKEALARAKTVAEIDEADADDDEPEAAGEADEETGNARARRRAAGSWRRRDISEGGRERGLKEGESFPPRARSRMRERTKKN